MKRNNVKHLLSAVSLAVAGVGATATQAATIDLTGVGFVQYGDGLSYSLPIANYSFGFSTNNGPYAVSSTPGAIQDLIVVATGSSGNPVTTNIAGIESAYATPSGVSGATFFSTGQSALLNNGTTGTIANQNNATWDANLASMKTFLAGDAMTVFFNNNNINAQGTSLQSLGAWARFTITDGAGVVVGAYEVTNNLGKYALVTEGGGGVAFGNPTTFTASNQTTVVGNPVAGSNARTDYILSGGSICVETGPALPLPKPVSCGSAPSTPGGTVSAPINHNLGADNAAYAVILPELNALMGSLFSSLTDAQLGQYTLHVDMRLGCDPATAPIADCTATPYGRDLNNGFEQVFIGTARLPTNVPEPMSLALLGLGLAGLGLSRRKRA